MHKGFLRMGAILGALSVIAGAFGAHAFKAVISEKGLAVFETSVRYQFYHALALLLTGILYKDFTNTFLLWSGRLFGFGILLFSGSLYLLSFFNTGVNDSIKWVGAITPIGGLSFILGWLSLTAGFKKN